MTLRITGMPGGANSQWLLRELRSLRSVIDAQPGSEADTYQLRLADGNPPEIIGLAVLDPLNTKLGQKCLSLAGANGTTVQARFAASCMSETDLGKWARLPPAGVQGASGDRGKLSGKPAT